MAIFRTLMGQAAPDSCAERTEQTTGSAKLALISVQRSPAALDSRRASNDEAEIPALMALLEALERGVDERFPAARPFVRVGLDCPVP